MHMSRKYLPFAFSALCILAVSASPNAVQGQASGPVIDVHTPSPAERVRHTKVSYSDLKLNTPTGQQAMLARLRRASRRVCGPAPNTSELNQSAAYHACFDGAMSGALADLGNSDVSALWDKTKSNVSPK
jgi:UrcA family protein